MKIMNNTMFRRWILIFLSILIITEIALLIIINTVSEEWFKKPLYACQCRSTERSTENMQILISITTWVGMAIMILTYFLITTKKLGKN